MDVGVIGGHGFVGTRLVAHLQARGVKVIGYSREIVNLCDPASMVSLGNHDIVVNCAANFGGNASEMYAVNVQGLQSLCAELNGRAKKPYLLQISSGAVYGFSEHAVDEKSVAIPRGDYALTKYLGDEIVRLSYQGLWSIARLYFPYGEGQAKERLMPRLINRILAGEVIDVSRNGGSPRINPIYIDDLCDQLHAMMINKTVGVHLLGGAQVVNIVEIIKIIGQVAGVEAKIREVDGENSNMFCEGKSIVTLEQGFTRLINSLRN